MIHDYIYMYIYKVRQYNAPPDKAIFFLTDPMMQFNWQTAEIRSIQPLCPFRVHLMQVVFMINAKDVKARHNVKSNTWCFRAVIRLFHLPLVHSRGVLTRLDPDGHEASTETPPTFSNDV